MRAWRSPASPRRAGWGWGLALGAALGLTACGAAHSPASNTERSQRQDSAQSATLASGTNGHCHEVAETQPKSPQHLAQPKLRLDPKGTYTVRLETNCGVIDIRLAVARAPRIAASFASLVRRGFYDELTFHLVIAGFLIQGGDPNGDGSGGPGYEVVERPPSGLRYTPGTVAMAKAPTQPAGSAGSQFFIVVGKDADLPPQYALLGRVVGGWSTVTAIANVPTESDDSGPDTSPESPIVISRAILSTS